MSRGFLQPGLLPARCTRYAAAVHKLATLDLRLRLDRLSPLRAGRHIHVSQVGACSASEQLAANGVGHGKHA